MKTWIKQVVFISAALAVQGSAALAQDTGAIASGNWSDPTIWTTGTIPGSANTVYIGSSNNPNGAIPTATVTLSTAESASAVVLGSGMGLTINGGGTLSIDSTSHMDLMFSLNSGPNWVFSWKDQVESNWISQIDNMIAGGEIVVNAPYTVDDRGGFTYIDGLRSSSVPEPSSLVLACLAGVGVTIAVRRQRRRARG